MQEYVWYLLLLNQVITVTFCEDLIKENIPPASLEIKETYLKNRRKLPIFPKTNIKFVVTTKPHIDQAYTYDPKEKIMTKMPSIYFVTPKVKTTAAMAHTSRKPLMKLRTFTIGSRANGKYKNIEKLTQNPVHVSKKTDNLRSTFDPVVLYNEDNVTEVYIPEESQINVGNKTFENDAIPVDYNQIKRDKESVIAKTKTEKISSEEEQDRNEFIFIEKEKQFLSDSLDNNDQDVERDVETTTEIKENLRVKRSNNIIEEENIGTTVSGLKYTGRDTRLVNNDMYFKNIHS